MLMRQNVNNDVILKSAYKKSLNLSAVGRIEINRLHLGYWCGKLPCGSLVCQNPCLQVAAQYSHQFVVLKKEGIFGLNTSEEGRRG